MSKLTTLIPQPRWTLLVSTLALASLAACNQQDDRTVGQKVDSGIAKTEQAAERAGDKVAAATDNAAAKVDQATDKAAASAERAGEKIEAAADKAVTATGDAATTAAVKTALIAAPGLSALTIDVDTQDAVVTLNGSVKTSAQKSEAVDVAKRVEGVKSVIDNLKTTG